MSIGISRGRRPSAPTTSLKKMQPQDVNNPTTEVRQILNKNPTSVIIIPSKEVVEETEVETTTGTSALEKSGSNKMGTEAEGAEDGEDAGQPHHQADPGQAPRHERQPSTICSKPIPNCPTKLLWSGYFLEFTKQNEKPPSSPIIPTK